VEADAGGRSDGHPLGAIAPAQGKSGSALVDSLRETTAIGSEGKKLRRTLAGAVILSVILLMVLYCLAIGPYWKLSPDSVTYVLGAKSLAAGKGYREAGKPVILYPPGSSIILAAGWLAGRGSYRLLNAEVVAFGFAAMVLCFLLFRPSLGALGSGLVVLMCLGSVTFFQSSTFLLSDMFYAFFSILGLYLYQRPGATRGTGLAVLAACTTRLIGVSLAAALLIDCLRSRPKRWGLAAAMGLGILFVGLWELRNAHMGWSHVGLMIQNDPWVASHGRISPADILRRFAINVTRYRDYLDFVANGIIQRPAWLLPLGLFVALGFRRLFWRGYTAAGIYFVLCAVIVNVYHPWVETRWLLPLLPLLFAYLLAGVGVVAEKVQGKAATCVYASFAVFLLLYLTNGVRRIVAQIPEERGTQVPGQLVKYPENYALQRLGLWMRDHSAPGDKYACFQPTLMDLITDRVGVYYPFTDDSEALENTLQRQRVRYVLMDLRSRQDRLMLLPAIEKSGHYRLVKVEGSTRLYESVPPGH